ncbi:MAG: hypothetical protein Alpg2KO_18100 [Alphaproteobacteria bacterium]
MQRTKPDDEKRFCAKRGKGASITGYGLVVGLISVVALVAVTSSGENVRGLFENVSGSLSGVSGNNGDGAGGNGANSQPSLSVGTVSPVEAGTGVQTVPGFASFNPGAGDSGQVVDAYIVVETADPANAVSGVSIDTSGTLSYSPDALGAADYSVTVRDDGGTANGGQDTSDPVTFSITVSPPPVGTGPCSDSTPDPGEEGCDPGDGTLFVGFFDSDLDSTQERLFVPAFDLNNSNGLMTDGVTDRGLIFYMDPAANSSTLNCPNSSTNSTACNDGIAMTASLLADTAHNFPAAERCNDLVANGHSDWYLPALRELNFLRNSLAVADTDANGDNAGDLFNFDRTSNFPANFYWQSSSVAAGGGYYIRFTDGTIFDGRGKRQATPVRCMRRTG